MKKIIFSLATVALVGAAVVGATRAYFTSTVVSAGNTFAAGVMELQIGGGGTLPFNVTNANPGQSGSGKMTLTNSEGNIDGNLSISLKNLVMAENGLTDPELDAGDYENGGDLHLFMQFAAYIDANQNATFDAGDTQLTYDGQQKEYPGFWGGDFHYAPITGMMNGSWNNIVTLAGGNSVDLVVMWQFPATQQDPNYNHNLAMTDSLVFDVEATLEQAP